MSPEQAIEYALSADETPLCAPPRRRSKTAGSPNTLTRREREVAVLIGRGLTNRRIAEELEIAERTVESHVSKILRKLGFHSRTQIATWIVQQGPLTGDPG